MFIAIAKIPADPAALSTHARQRGLDQLGTMGAGNHFVEIDRVSTIFDPAAAERMGLFRGQVDLARMTYLERENRSLTSLLDGQAEQLSRLKLEVARLKEFEQSLRVVSGMDAQVDPMVGSGQTRGTKRELPRKR